MIVDIVFGFLGAGKTTFITRVLQDWGPREKIVVLVNEFGEVGIDGELLAAQGGNVVEMPSGCICCTLQGDLKTQMLDINRTIGPQRLIIEPTGVATISQLRSVVESQLFESAIEKIHNILIVDGTGFMGLYRANRHFVENQVRSAHLVLLNKCDKVDNRKARLTRDAVSAINPEVTVLMTEFGAVDWAEYQAALSTASGRREERGGRPPDRPRDETEEEGAGTGPFVAEEEDALGYESFGCSYRDLCFDRGALENLFEEFNAPRSRMGDVVRAKGIFRVGSGWVLLELASGESSSQPIQQSKESRVSIIGKNLNREGIGTALEECLLK